jgi:3-hydroxyisobutyrate dehydrogenase
MAEVGFVGLGHMGQPMALNLLRGIGALTVWNRSREKLALLLEAGAREAVTLDELFGVARIVFLMLENEAAIDAVLDRDGPDFRKRVQGHVIVHMGTTAPAYSLELEGAICGAGGSYVEVPVSGSRVPAERGELVGMVAGEKAPVAEILPLLAYLCRRTLPCGAVPQAARMKLAVNHFLLTMVAGLAEAFHFARCQDLDMQLFNDILASGPMASDVSRIKGTKLLHADFAAQAALSDVLKNARLVMAASQEGGIAAPILDVCTQLYARAVNLGLGQSDMAAVIKTFGSPSAFEDCQ